MKQKALYQKLASLVIARENCDKATPRNTEWYAKHTETILELVKAHMPSGSGIDSGTDIDLDASNPEKLVFLTSYHHMNDGGYYDGWTEHSVIVTPSLSFGFNIRITGNNRNDIKDYLHDVFSCALESEVAQ